jgi:transposase InsO family protein
MLSDISLAQYCSLAHSLSQSAKDYINVTRSSPAARMVGRPSGKNICSWIHSIKMGRTVSLESRSPERGFFTLCEYDDRVLEYWDQPDPVNITRTNKNGRQTKGTYNPDALVLTKDGPKVVEVKNSDFVEAKLAEGHADWVRHESGKISYLPAEESFSEIGIPHEVFVCEPSMRYKVANIQLLLQSREFADIEAEAAAKIKWSFSDQFFFSLTELKEKAGLASCLPIIQLIDHGKLFADLDKTLLSSPDGSVVTLTEKLLPHALAMAQAGQIASCEESEAFSTLEFPSQKAAEDALKRLRVVQSGGKGRSARRYRKMIAEGRERGLSDFQSLIDRRAFSGNRHSKLPFAVRHFMSEFLQKEYLSKGENRSVYSCYMAYRVAAKENHPGLDPSSRITFSGAISKIPHAKVARAHKGRRSGNSAEEPTNPLKRNLKPQAPWQVASIDHGLSDIWLVVADANGNQYVARPWITILIDIYSGKVLGMAISFSSPSRKANAKAVRDCVRRHGRLPSEIISDRGSDFTSVYFESLLAHYAITYSLRPAGHSRFGSEVEGFFGEFKRQWLCRLPGYISNAEEIRSIDGDFRPDKCAVLRPREFVRHLKEFLSWRDMRCRGVSSFSPEHLFTNPPLGDHLFGQVVTFNDEFVLATAVESKKYKIDFQRGLHIGGMWFWNENLSGLQGVSKSVDVRIDPENPHLVFALVRNEWVPCYSGRINSYSALDPVSQIVEGLLITESKSSRQQAFDDAGETAARIIAEMDDISRSDESTAIAVFDTPERDDPASVFQAFASSSVDTVNLEFWES